MINWNGISDWDASIRKVPLEYNGTKSNAWSVQREDWIKEDLGENTTTGPVWNEVGVVSDNYLLIPNTKVVELAKNISEMSQYNWEPDKTFWNGRQFMYSLVSKDCTEEVSIGDDIALGMMFWNSYDGSTALQFKLYLQRLVCLNGMVSNDIFSSYKFKHTERSEGYEDEIIEASKIINSSNDNIRYFVNGLRLLDNTELNMEVLSHIREQYLTQIPVSLFGTIMDKLLNYRPNGKPTVYDLLNSSTNILWHKKKQTKADFDHNSYIVDKLINYANDSSGIVR